MLPQITELELNIDEIAEEDLPKIGKSFLFDFKNGEFVLKDGKPVAAEGLEALKIWVTKTIMTEKDRFTIYENTDYGTTIEDLIGSNYPREFVESEIKREITEALINHSYIQNITDLKLNKDGSSMKIKFTVVTADGAFEQEVKL